MFIYQAHSASNYVSNKMNAISSYCSLKGASMAGGNSDMGPLCNIFLNFPEVILIVLDISANCKDKSKDVLTTVLNKFPDSYLNPQVLHNSQKRKNFNTNRRNIRISNNNIRCCSRKRPISKSHTCTQSLVCYFGEHPNIFFLRALGQVRSPELLVK